MTKYEPIPKEPEHRGKALLDAALEVYTILGAGFLERVYKDALCCELFGMCRSSVSAQWLRPTKSSRSRDSA